MMEMVIPPIPIYLHLKVLMMEVLGQTLMRWAQINTMKEIHQLLHSHILVIIFMQYMLIVEMQIPMETLMEMMQ